MACMKADKSEKVIAATETTMQQQELSLNDTSLTKVVKRKPNGKSLNGETILHPSQGTERLFKMNLMTTIKRVIIFVQPASCLCLILKQNSIQERMA
jgi:hypothetical protein